jgi:ribonucleotide monophosphatase NagD (HAD superfamily)
MEVSGLLVDLDGTLYVGDEPVPGAIEAVGRLAGAGLSLRFVTNTTRKPGGRCTRTFSGSGSRSKRRRSSPRR